MKRSIPLIFAVALAPVMLDMVPQATEKVREIVILGFVSCTKCDRGESKECVDALEAKVGNRTKTIYLANDENREDCGSTACREGQRQVRVTGVPFRKAGKRWVAPTRVESILHADFGQAVITTDEARVQ